MFNEEKIVLPSIAHFQSIARGGKNRVFPVGFPRKLGIMLVRNILRHLESLTH